MESIDCPPSLELSLELSPEASPEARAETSPDPLAHLERARQLVPTDPAFARIEYGRALRWSTPGDHAWAEAANDLGVLHFQDRRPDLAHGFLAAAHRSFPEQDLYRANLDAVGSPPATGRPAVAVKDPGGVASVGHWVVKALSHCDELVSFRGKRVLEIGGALPAQAIRPLNVASWTSVDPLAPAFESPGHRVLDVSAADLPLPEASVDLAFSCCAFEHIHDLAGVLRELERVLRPGGLVFSEFAPIWSSAHGHHTWVLGDDGRTAELTFVDGVVPAWAHLLWGEEEFGAYLEPTHGREIAGKAAAAAYRGTYVNRMFEDDYYRAFADSGLVVQRLEHLESGQRPSELLQTQLEAAHPGRTNFRAQGFRYVAARR